MSSSVVVYRNPIEQWFWEHAAFYVFGGLAAIFAVAVGIVLVAVIHDRWSRRKKRRPA